MQCAGIAVLLLFVVNLRASSTFHYKVCSGSTNLEAWANNYRKVGNRFTNCTHIDGNLVIPRSLNDDEDMSSLNDIREVTGYVRIYDVKIRRLVLPNLTIILGRTLTETYEIGSSLLVHNNEMEILELPALREISAGKVKFLYNGNLCFINSIKWEDIVKDFVQQPLTFKDSTSPGSCPACHESCTGGCWGPGPLSCQKFSKINCSRKCGGVRCFGPNDQECCHSFCAGGCTGPTQSDCFACKNFNDSGICKEECPRTLKYNPATKSLERNPKGKYEYFSICVKDCPEHLLRDSGGACVAFCSDFKKAVDGECVPCGDGPCPRVCRDVDGGYVRPANIHNFAGCTVIDGNLIIDGETFVNDLSSDDKFSSMHPDALEVFSAVRVVTGFVDIMGNHPDFKNLSYFRNLEIIQGK